MKRGVELRISGIVQGVGFRPFIYRLARKYGYSGFVANTGSGITIQIDQQDERFDEFLADVRRLSPPMASITSVVCQEVIPEDSVEFVILASESLKETSVSIPPDIALCPDCLTELFSQTDRRYLYPFINCTNCGPRLSIVKGIPYDRPLTSMACFPMCPECEAEYNDPVSRRFHAQPNSCWQCGPTLSWHDGECRRMDCGNPIAEADRALTDGKVVALRGIGGFHLAVDARSEEAVEKLRRVKGRKSKPLAVMAADMATVRKYWYAGPEEEALLSSFRSPIVLLRDKAERELARGLAPGLDETGVMLPYSPLHYLLFACSAVTDVLVMTSANYSGEPLCAGNREAAERLSGLADFFLLHNREIVNRLDDSVARMVSGKASTIRRSRGYVLEPVHLDQDYPGILACGGETKNAFCFIKENRAYLSQHIGTLTNPAVFNHYLQSIQSLGSLLDVEPEIVACDLHPDYPSSNYARSSNLPIFEVQHHHAHAVAVMAEHGLTGECLAIVMDGAGLGPDRTVWGGEVMLVDYASYRRLAHLQLLPMPGGDLAARELYRMGFAAWWKSRGEEGNDLPAALWNIPAENREILSQMIGRGINTPVTSSCGRLFDAVASLLNLRQESDYEGQSAMELEAMAYRALGCQSLSVADLPGENLLPVSFDNLVTPIVLHSLPMIRELLSLLDREYERESLALAFHRWLISSIASVISEDMQDIGHLPVILAGGCLQNTLLLQGLQDYLRTHGFQVYRAEKVPANDGCIALGQGIIAGTRFLQQS